MRKDSKAPGRAGEKEKLRAEKKQAAQDARLAARQTKLPAKQKPGRQSKHRKIRQYKKVLQNPSDSFPVFRQEKKRKLQTIEDYLPIEKIAHGVIYTTDGRYVKILEVEPINFLLRSSREQMGIIYSFISYLKISPVKLQIKMISKRADINQHLERIQTGAGK